MPVCVHSALSMMHSYGCVAINLGVPAQNASCTASLFLPICGILMERFEERMRCFSCLKQNRVPGLKWKWAQQLATSLRCANCRRKELGGRNMVRGRQQGSRAKGSHLASKRKLLAFGLRMLPPGCRDPGMLLPSPSTQLIVLLAHLMESSGCIELCGSPAIGRCCAPKWIVLWVETGWRDRYPRCGPSYFAVWGEGQDDAVPSAIPCMEANPMGNWILL